MRRFAASGQNKGRGNCRALRFCNVIQNPLSDSGDDASYLSVRTKSPERLVRYEQDHQDNCGSHGWNGSDGWHGGCRAAARVASSALPAASAPASCRSPRSSRRQRRLGRARSRRDRGRCRRTDRRSGELRFGTVATEGLTFRCNFSHAGL